MENIVQAISAVGFPIIACLLVAYAFYKMIISRLSIQDSKIEKLEIENKEDKKLFNKAVDVFNESVIEFKETNREMKQIKQDVELIKNKLK